MCAACVSGATHGEGRLAIGQGRSLLQTVRSSCQDAERKLQLSGERKEVARPITDWSLVDRMSNAQHHQLRICRSLAPDNDNANPIALNENQGQKTRQSGTTERKLRRTKRAEKNTDKKFERSRYQIVNGPDRAGHSRAIRRACVPDETINRKREAERRTERRTKREREREESNS